VVAVDSGVDHIFSYGGITPDNAVPLVHGCIFTRGPADLKRTAIFVGGSDVTAGEAVVRAVRQAMNPFTVSVMLDSNGANTTAAAAVRAAARHLDLSRSPSLVLGGTGPVGQRVARLLAKAGGHVRIGSRSQERAEAVATAIRLEVPGANLEAVATASSADGPRALEGRTLVVAAGAAGSLLLPSKIRQTCSTLKVAIDLNGVPPEGIEGVQLTDKGIDREGVLAYGALGVGGTKMKIHRLALQELFTRNDAHLDIDAIYQIAETLP
jgi:hypothetical protein